MRAELVNKDQTLLWIKIGGRMVIARPFLWIGGFSSVSVLCVFLALRGILLSLVLPFIIIVCFLAYARIQYRGPIFNLGLSLRIEKGLLGRLFLMGFIYLALILIPALPSAC